MADKKTVVASGPYKTRKPIHIALTEPDAIHVYGIVRGRIYSRAEILIAFKIHETTLSKWMAGGLKPGNGGTKTHFFFGDQVIRHLFGE